MIDILWKCVVVEFWNKVLIIFIIIIMILLIIKWAIQATSLQIFFFFCVNPSSSPLQCLFFLVLNTHHLLLPFSPRSPPSASSHLHLFSFLRFDQQHHHLSSVQLHHLFPCLLRLISTIITIASSSHHFFSCCSPLPDRSIINVASSLLFASLVQHHR